MFLYKQKYFILLKNRDQMTILHCILAIIKYNLKHIFFRTGILVNFVNIIQFLIILY